MWAKGSSCDVPGLARSSTAFRLNGARGEPNATVVIAHAVRRTRSPGAIMRDIAQAMTMAGVRKGNRCGWIWDPVVRVTVALSELTSCRSLLSFHVLPNGPQMARWDLPPLNCGNASCVCADFKLYSRQPLHQVLPRASTTAVETAARRFRSTLGRWFVDILCPNA